MRARTLSRGNVSTMNAQVTPNRPIEVRAWLDVACPWCWISKRRFEAATSEYGGEVAVEYHSFELAPDLPTDYLSTEADFLQFHYRGRTRTEVAQMMWLVKSTGARHGLSYDFDRVQHCNTFLAHQLLHHAKAQRRQLPMLEVLFSAFFERGRDLRGVDELVALAAEVDLEAGETRKALQTGRFAGAARADRDAATAYGVTKIPTYVVGRQPPIHGAKRPAMFVEALRAAAAQAQR